MGIFSRKQAHIGEVSREVRVHYRKLRGVPLPNVPEVAHWALQVGEYTYEVAAPPAAIFTQQIALWLSKEIKKKIRDGDEDYDEEEMLNDIPLDDDEEIEFEGGSPFDGKPNEVMIQPGQNKWKVPLQIGPSKYWNSSKFNKDSRSIHLGYTHLKPEYTWHRAYRIFKQIFQQGYDMLYNNCHAFVCHLWTAIQLMDPPKLKYDRRFFPTKPPFENRHFYLSIVSYVTWKHVAGEPIERPPGAIWRYWELKEKYVEYNKLIPPRRMKEILEPNERPPPRRTPKSTSKPTHAPDHGPKSHAAHASNMAHHSSAHNRDIALQNAMLVQQQAIQPPMPPVPTTTMPDPTSMGLLNIGIPAGMY